MSIPRIIVLSATALLVVCAAAYGLSEALSRDEQTRTFVRDTVTKIIVRTDAGDVDIRAGLTSAVVVERTDHWILDRPSVDTELREDGTLVLESACDGAGLVLRCETDFRIAAPPGVDVEVDGSAGDIALRGLRGRVRVETDAGNILASRLEPVVLDARTDAGDVDLDLFGSPARTNATSDAGDVRVVVPYGAYHVAADTDSGDVQVAGLIRDDLSPQRIEAGTDAGDVSVVAR